MKPPENIVFGDIPTAPAVCTNRNTNARAWRQVYRYARIDAKKPRSTGAGGASRVFSRTVTVRRKHSLGGNGGIRTLDEALHPILP
jgi:hypothetical protein